LYRANGFPNQDATEEQRRGLGAPKKLTHE
jgi:hypothetical protein